MLEGGKYEVEVYCIHRRRLFINIGGKKFLGNMFIKFKKKIPFYSLQISDDLFLVIDNFFQNYSPFLFIFLSFFLFLLSFMFSFFK